MCFFHDRVAEWNKIFSDVAMGHELAQMAYWQGNFVVSLLVSISNSLSMMRSWKTLPGDAAIFIVICTTISIHTHRRLSVTLLFTTPLCNRWLTPVPIKNQCMASKWLMLIVTRSLHPFLINLPPPNPHPSRHLSRPAHQLGGVHTDQGLGPLIRRA